MLQTRLLCVLTQPSRRQIVKTHVHFQGSMYEIVDTVCCISNEGNNPSYRREESISAVSSGQGRTVMKRRVRKLDTMPMRFSPGWENTQNRRAYSPLLVLMLPYISSRRSIFTWFKWRTAQLPERRTYLCNLFFLTNQSDVATTDSPPELRRSRLTSICDALPGTFQILLPEIRGTPSSALQAEPGVHG
jgi:hypothetical protein